MMTASQHMIDVTVSPHPFTLQRLHQRMAAGGTVEEIVQALQPDQVLRKHAHVYVGGAYVPQDKWAKIRPKAGASLNIRMAPMGGGGGGKNPLRTVLSLAVIAATAGLGSVIGGATFAGLNLGRGLTLGVNLLGRLALNALAPPPRAKFNATAKESPTLFIQAARNDIAPFARVPKVLGRHRFVPPMGARPYTETIGNDQYLRMLFVWGYGPLEISDLKIGETPLSEFNGVQIETRQGYATDAPITLYSNSVLQNDLQVNLTNAAGYVTRTTETDAEEISIDVTLPRGLFSFNGSGDKIAASVKLEAQYSPKGLNQWSVGATPRAISAQTLNGITRPTAYTYANVTYVVKRIDRIVLDPANGIAKVISGTPFRQDIDVGSPQPPLVPEGFIALARVERRSNDTALIPAGRIADERDGQQIQKYFSSTGDFTVSAGAGNDSVSIAAGNLTFVALEISGKQSAALRKPVIFHVPKGQYDVRLRRITPDSTDDNTFDETIWTALRTVRYARPVNMQGIAMTALRIKATDQLNGVIDRFNGVVQSILPDWNGTAWSTQATSNPASLFRHVLQGNANARPLADSRLDLAKIEAWHNTCAADGREFNAVIDYDTSVRDILQDIAATGRASPTLIDGKWAVVEDKPQTVPIQHFTPRNTFGFRGEKAFDEVPEALRVRFINREKGWLQDERIVFDDGFDAASATKYETLELPGVTSPTQAWRDGRYHLATARLRPETYSFHADVEHIVCTRGDLIRFTHDVPLFGLMSARVKSIATSGANITSITLDAGMPMEAGKSYAMRFRRADGSSVTTTLVTQAGLQLTVLPGAALPVASGPIAGDLAMFGESGQESVALIVKSIEPGSDLNALITCVAASDDIHIAPLAPMPVFESVLTGVGILQRPPVPIVLQIQSGLESMIRHADGSLTSRILITLSPPAFGRRLETRVSLRARDETEFRPADFVAAEGGQISVLNVAEGETYDLQIRYVTIDDIFSSPLVISGYRVEGTTGLPSDVSGLSMNIMESTAYLSWLPVPDIDLSHYTLRYAPQLSGATWGGSTDLVARIPKTSTSISVPAAVGTFLLKAVDIGGRQSAQENAVVSSIAGLAGFNAILNVIEDSDFLGVKTDVSVVGGALQLSGNDSIDDWTDVDAVLDVDIGMDGLAPSGVYEFANDADLGAVYTSRLTVDMSVVGFDVNLVMDNWVLVDEQESWDQEVAPSLWSVQVQLSTTNDDPSGSPDWSDWMPLSVGDYSARAFRFRALLQGSFSSITPLVSRLRVNIDMPDRTAGARNLTAPPAGTSVSFTRPFRAAPAVAITAQNMSTGDYYTITAITAAGFNIQFFNAAAAGISRVFDYLAQGYGEEINP